MKTKKKMIWQQISNITPDLMDAPIDEIIKKLQSIKKKYPNKELQIGHQLDWNDDVCLMIMLHRLESDIEFKNRVDYEALTLKFEERAELKEYIRLKKKYGE